ncbi:MAG: transporter [Elusimicrobiota bacterium]
MFFIKKDAFSFALKPGFSIPTGDWKKGLGSGKLSFATYLILSYEIEKLAIHTNIGYIRNNNKVEEKENLYH